MYGYGNSLYLTANKILASANAGNPPVNTVAPVISGLTTLGSVLTSTTGTWTGTAPITYTYQWKRNGSNIGSATNSTYTLVTADVSQSITCQVTATNAVGSANATSNTITPASAVDPDAQAFITAAGITDPTQQAAINTLVVDLKGYSIWTKKKAIYPIVGGTASSHAVNLKTPGTFNLTFSTGWTHSSTGMLPNGSSAYANTAFVPSTNGLTYNNNHLSFYSRTSTAKDFYEMGSTTSPASTDIFSLWTRRTANTAGYDSGNFSTNRLTASNTDGRGFYVNTAPSTTSKIFKNGTSLASKTLSMSSISSVNVYIGGLIEGGGSLYYSDKQCAFASIGNGLTDTEAANFYTAVQAFQTTLSRQV
jgi:hypothetical protein